MGGYGASTMLNYPPMPLGGPPGAAGTFAGGASKFVIGMQALGADGTGGADVSGVATAAKAQANAVNGLIDFDPGIYLFNQSVDFTGYSHRFAPGVTLKVAAGQTVTLGRIIAGNYGILDKNTTGTFLLSYNPGNQTDIVDGRWGGLVADGSTDDTKALNLVTNLCIGQPGQGNRNGVSNSFKNRPLILPPGTISLQSGSWDISGSTGFVIRGQGRLTTKISVDVANTVGIKADATNYLRMENLIIQTTQNQDTSHPLMDLDNTGTYTTGYLLPQQCTWDKCYFSGTVDNIHFAQIGLSIARTGGGTAQGDTMYFPNTLFASFKFAGIAIGSLVVQAQNALDMNVQGGDFQGHPLYAIFNNGGQIRVNGVGMQNQGKVPYLDSGNNPTNFNGATHVGNYNQIDTGGADMWAHWSGGSRSALLNMRSEGFVLARNTGVGRVDNCALMGGGISPWTATSAFPQGFIIGPSGNATASGYQGGAFAEFLATPTPGNLKSGASEPDWAGAKFGYVEEGLSVTSTQTVLAVRAPLRLTNPVFDTTWGAIVVDLTGVNQKFYTTITAASLYTSITLAAGMPWSSTNVTVHIGPIISDGGLSWIPYNWIGLEGEFEFITAIELNFAQINPQLAVPQFISGRSSRQDPFWEPRWSFFNPGSLAFSPGNINLRIGPATATNANFPFVPNNPFFLDSSASSVRSRKLTSRTNFNDPITWDEGWGGSPAGIIGIGRLIGVSDVAGTPNDLSFNYVGIVGGVIGGEPAGFPTTLVDASVPPNGPANTVGGNFIINAGPGTGSQPSGSVIFQTAPAGGAGSAFNALRNVGNFDATGRLNTKFSRAVSAVSGTINITNAGSATPGVNTVECSRYNLQGATATINNPTDVPVDGQVWRVEFLNNSGANSTVTFGTAYLIGATSTVLANTHWMTFDFVWDASISKFKLRNTNGL